MGGPRLAFRRVARLRVCGPGRCAAHPFFCCREFGTIKRSIERPFCCCSCSLTTAGDALLRSVRRACPGVSVGKILIQRDEATKEKHPRLLYSKFPADLRKRDVIIVDPMLASGGSIRMAIGELIRAGVKEDRILFLNVVSCPEGIEALFNQYPKVKVVTASVDDGLNDDKYIVPGLGDFGDRYYGTN